MGRHCFERQQDAVVTVPEEDTESHLQLSTAFDSYHNQQSYRESHIKYVKAFLKSIYGFKSQMLWNTNWQEIVLNADQRHLPSGVNSSLVATKGNHPILSLSCSSSSSSSSSSSLLFLNPFVLIFYCSFSFHLPDATQVIQNQQLYSHSTTGLKVFWFFLNLYQAIASEHWKIGTERACDTFCY